MCVMGVNFTGVHLIGVYLMGVYLIGVYIMVFCDPPSNVKVGMGGYGKGGGLWPRYGRSPFRRR
jgi:hypothetical protein